MSPSDPDSPSRRILSALADGEAAEGECADVFLAWREDAEVRAAWHAYHLIGDVLRSEDLAAPAEGSCRLLQAVRERLAQEPVVLAPVSGADSADVAAAPQAAPIRVAGGEPLASRARSARWRSRWQGPTAMAAGFLAVVVGVQVARAPGDRGVNVARLSPAGASVAGTGRRLASDRVLAGATTPLPAQVMPYVTAHRLSTMDAVLTMPGQMPAGELRNATIVQPSQQ